MMRTDSGDNSASERLFPAGTSPFRGNGQARARYNGSANGRRDLLRLHNLHADKPAEHRAAFEGVDSWRWQYFEGVACPRSLVVPIDDPTAWRLFPDRHKIYDKLFICESQGIAYGPHGIMPDRFPVFSKPIMNLHGMGTGGRIIHTAAELEAHFAPGHMWMTHFTGRHVSTDVALVGGTPRWWCHTVGKPLPGGMFDYWIVLAERLPVLEAYLGRWIRANLRGFTGIVNFESIGGAIIECHLRMSEQWVDLNGPGWLEAVVELYARGRWRYRGRRKTGYSSVLFGLHGPRYWIDPERVAALRALPGVSSIQITFDPLRPPEYHAMPPGGFRLAIVNSWDLETGRAVRARLRRLFKVMSTNGGPPAAEHSRAAGRRQR